MKALSVKQPWAHAIVRGWKDVENRSRRTKHRGWLVIHASGSPNRQARYPRRWKTPDVDTLPTSAIVGVAWLHYVVTPHRSPWYSEGNYAWVLNIKRACKLKKPILCKGKLGVWNVPPALVRALRRQLPGLKPGSRGGHRAAVPRRPPRRSGRRPD